jgi:hypothetical protein
LNSQGQFGEVFDRVEDRLYLMGKGEIILDLFTLTPLYQKLHYLFPISGENG